jgi:hypothetical protein
VPLPPYIKEKLEDKERYQTVYAKIEGSAAAPTAGLHFTDEIFEQLKQKGVTILEVTLHIGLGTFRPVDVEDVTKHQMHSEWFLCGCGECPCPSAPPCHIPDAVRHQWHFSFSGPDPHRAGAAA